MKFWGGGILRPMRNPFWQKACLLAVGTLALASCDLLPNPLGEPGYRGALLYSGEPAACHFGDEVPNGFEDKSGIEAVYFEWEECLEAGASGRYCYFTAPSAGDYWFSAADIGCGAYEWLGATEFRPKRGVVPCDLYVENKSFDTVRPTDNWGSLQCKVNFSKGERARVFLTPSKSNVYTDEDWLDAKGNQRIYLTIAKPFSEKKYASGSEEEVEGYRCEEFDL